jgi:Ca-activated chloride channel family protein
MDRPAEVVMRAPWSVVVCVGLIGCGGYSNSLGGSEFGATQGGVQDMGLAREMIAAGFVPPPEAFVVEGMFSEHDLPVTGPACETVLCLRAAAAIAPDADDKRAGWLQIGMSSTIDPDAFVRPSQTIVAVVDVSGSMSWGYHAVDAGYSAPGELSRDLLSAIAHELGPHDRIAIVTFGSNVHDVLGFVPGGDPAVDAAIAALSEDGSTNMEAGLERGYELARDADFVTDETRVMLFTDAQPNVGATGSDDFEAIARQGADDGIGLTAFAMGVGMGQDVLLGMSHLRGGNAFSLFEADDVDALMADSWPWMVSPIAYDLHVDVAPADGFTPAAAYGFPDDGAPGLDVATVFLSRRRGAMLVELAPGEGVDVDALSATATIAYHTPDGHAVSELVGAGYDGGPYRSAWYGQPGVQRTVALALLVDGMGDAAADYATDPAAAIDRMTAVDARFTADVAGDDDLAAEVELSHQLLALMVDGAQQADLYGWGE